MFKFPAPSEPKGIQMPRQHTGPFQEIKCLLLGNFFKCLFKNLQTSLKIIQNKAFVVLCFISKQLRIAAIFFFKTDQNPPCISAWGMIFLTPAQSPGHVTWNQSDRSNFWPRMYRDQVQHLHQMPGVIVAKSIGLERIFIWFVCCHHLSCNLLPSYHHQWPICTQIFSLFERKRLWSSRAWSGNVKCVKICHT